jgi:hypothetical protein
MRHVELAASGFSREMEMGIIWTILIGFIAGVLAKFVTPGDTSS